jgi:hypothetical protein
LKFRNGHVFLANANPPDLKWLWLSTVQVCVMKVKWWVIEDMTGPKPLYSFKMAFNEMNLKRASGIVADVVIEHYVDSSLAYLPRDRDSA